MSRKTGGEGAGAARKPINRRDFMNGVAITVGASLCPVHGAMAQSSGPDPSPIDPLLARGSTQGDPRYYPPALEGTRGSHPGSFETAHEVRDEKRWRDFRDVVDTGEHYDLVVVGGGISGLSAAYFFRQQNPNGKVLVLDNHDDFGGHAKRNEFNTRIITNPRINPTTHSHREMAVTIRPPSKG